MRMDVILASSSIYRKSLLDRLKLDFRSISPDIDETRLCNESAGDYVKRLARQKAETVAVLHPESIVIGSDQCAVRGDTILGKPGNHDNALEQLRAAQGRTVVFHTGLCVLQQSSGFCALGEELFEVDFRRLRDDQLEHYLNIEQPYQCAGSFKSEGFGIVLFDRMRGDDPTALIGLPLIRLTKMLESAGLSII
jgi:MAF protein